MYIPSHIGIPGNEAADEKAKQAITSPEAKICKIQTPSDLKSHIKKHFWETRDQKWREYKTHLSAILPSTYIKLPNPCGRRNEIVINRIRLGHTRLTHSYLLTKTEPPTCDTCQKPLTVSHIILECVKYRAQREIYNIQPTLVEALGENLENVNNVLEFLRDSNLLYDI